MTARRRRRPSGAGVAVPVLAAALVGLVGLAGCTSGAADPATPPPATAPATTVSTADGATTGSTVSTATITTGTSTTETTTTGTTTSETTTSKVSLVPQTPDGLATGPGVDDTSITLGAVIDPAADRGFLTGFRLWQSTINADTGVCGRTVALALAPASDTPTMTAYRDLAPATLGLITLPAVGADRDLAAQITADQVPAVTPAGLSTDLDPFGPMIVGATADIMAINGASYLAEVGAVTTGVPVPVVHDGSAEALDALTGLTWWAEQADVPLDLRGPDVLDDLTAPGVVVLGGPELTADVLAATPATTTVVATLDGYDPDTVTAADAARLLVGMPTTALDSDHPGALAVMAAYTAGGGTDPGPLLFAGYAVGTIWGRLLDQACASGQLTRAGIRAAATAIGPDSPDSLLGAVDLAPLVSEGLPATKVSALSAADPAAPGGLTTVTGLRSAPGIADYPPG